MKKNCVILLIASLLFTHTIHAAEARVNKISVESMIGQMIAIGFEGERATDEWTKLVREQIKNGEIGAVILYPRNIVSPKQLEGLTKTLHYAISGSLPFWVMVDQEGGNITRLNAKKGFMGFPSAKKMSESSVQTAAAKYRDMACELRGYGINFNLAPVIDLEQADSLISTDKRSFSDDPQIVVRYAEAFIKSHNSCGIWSSVKHFPGIGGTTEDTHIDKTNATETYTKNDIVPFEMLIKNAHSVMVSHIIDENIDNLPASLSKPQIDRLRELGFEGVVITDDLQMGAIANYYDLNETVVNAINAGNDVLLFSNMFTPDQDLPSKIRDIVINAINNNDIAIERIREAYNHIVTLKKKRLQ